MPSDRHLLYLEQMLAAIVEIESYIEGMDLAEYISDSKTEAAVERKLLVISEAAIRLGENAELM